MELSKRELRQMELLSETCKFDMKKKSALVQLHYETPEELLDVHLTSPEKPVVSDETIEYLCDIISEVPKKFSVEFSLTVDDYGAYTPESLMNALRTTVENTFYYHDENRKKTNVLSVIFLVIGILILALETVGGASGWFGGAHSISKEIVSTVLDVLVWAFIWEGAAMLFLTYESESTAFSGNIRRFCGMRLLDENGCVRCGLTEDQFFDGWIYLGGKEIFARNYILFSNAALLALFSVKIFELIPILGQISGMELGFFIVYGALILLLVISHIAYYRGSGRMKKLAPILSVVVLLLSIVSILYCVLRGAPARYAVSDAVLAADLVINFVCLRYMKRLSVEVK